MNAKDLKFLELFEAFVNINYLEDATGVEKLFNKFIALDFDDGLKMWEYLATTKGTELNKNTRFATLMGYNIFNKFYTKTPTKCIKAMIADINLRKVVFTYSPMAGKENAFNILVNLVVGAKIKEADDFFKALIKNEHINLGETLKLVIEQIFVELLKKDPTKISMNKKQSELLITYVRKIKGDEKALLEQRIKETQN